MSVKKAHKKANLKTSLALGTVAVASISFAPGAARAQSSVTLYGIADVGIEYLNNTSAGGSQVREVSGNLSGSRWGLKGVEDMGGGLKALFNLEAGFNINDGTSSQSTRGLGTNPTTTSRLFGRQAWVGLSYKGQQLTFGRQNALIYEQSVTFDPMGVSSRYSALSLDYALAARIDDSAKYTGKFGPVTAQAMYSTRYDTGYGAEVPGAPTTGRFFSGALTYSSGPLAATAVYEQRNSNTLTTATSTERRVLAAATYNFGLRRLSLSARIERVPAGESHQSGERLRRQRRQPVLARHAISDHAVIPAHCGRLLPRRSLDGRGPVACRGERRLFPFETDRPVRDRRLRAQQGQLGTRREWLRHGGARS